MVRYGGTLLAVYRDERGTVHARAPHCSHMDCIVQWNAAERAWDCPCHGGRYAATGERLNGPPAADLGPAQL